MISKDAAKEAIQHVRQNLCAIVGCGGAEVALLNEVLEHLNLPEADPEGCLIQAQEIVVRV